MRNSNVEPPSTGTGEPSPLEERSADREPQPKNEEDLERVVSDRKPALGPRLPGLSEEAREQMEPKLHPRTWADMEHAEEAEPPDAAEPKERAA